MPENNEHLGGLPKGYKFDRGGMPAVTAAYVCIVKNTVDPLRMGRIQVYVEEFGARDPSNQSNWTTVQYLSPFYGVTAGTSTASPDRFTNNRQSYGMWFTPPDVETRVLCLFVNGDPSLGYYLGSIPEPGLVHMLPAIGAGVKGVQYTNPPVGLDKATQLPVIEINDSSSSQGPLGTPDFYKQPRPIHSVVAAAMLQQGTVLDNQRGPINSSAQRESPSRAFGVSTPGRPVYQGGYKNANFKSGIDSNPSPSQVNVLARQGGHSIVLDDGDVDGNNQLTRIRTSKGHQIMMNDSGNFIHIIHANGQTWIELGQEGTVDVYSTNSVNVRTQGTINLHADKDVNIHAGRNLNMYGNTNVSLQSVKNMSILSQAGIKFTGQKIEAFSTGQLNLQSATGSWTSGSKLNVTAGQVLLNSGKGPLVTPDIPQVVNRLIDTKYNASAGWNIVVNSLQTITTRAPTHEPYPYHNLGVDVKTSITD